MTTKKWLSRAIRAGGVMAAFIPMSGLTAQEAQPAQIEIRAVELTGELGNDSLTFTAEPTIQNVSEYWIGVSLEPLLNDVVKSQLSIDHGLSLNTVYPDSPAEKAGLKAHDIILKAGDAAIKEPSDLVNAVSAAKESELTLVIVRGGKEQTLKVTPAKRAALQAQVHVEATGEPGYEPHTAQLQLHFDKALDALKGDRANMFLFRPGVIGGNPIVAHVVTTLPKNVSIQISKEGDKPAKVTVKRDGQSWETTEDKLDSIPEDLRVHIQPMLQNPGQLRIHAFGQPVPGVPNVTAVPPVAPPTGVAPKAWIGRDIRAWRGSPEEKKQIETLIDEVRQLRKEVQDLRGAQK